MVELQLPKLVARVRFPSSAPIFNFYHEKTSLKEVSLKRTSFSFCFKACHCIRLLSITEGSNRSRALAYRSTSPGFLLPARTLALPR